MRNFLAGLFIFILVFSGASVSGAVNKEQEERSRVSFEISYNMFFFDDEIYEDVFDKDSFPAAGVGIGFYPIRNLGLVVSALMLDEKGHALGEITGEESGEEFLFNVYPLQLSLSYRFDFLNEQLFVPIVSAGGDYYFYTENRDHGDDVDGGKTGYHMSGGLAVLLDRLDIYSAASIKSEFGVKNVFLEFRYETAFIEDNDGLDFTNDHYSAVLLFEF